MAAKNTKQDQKAQQGGDKIMFLVCYFLTWLTGIVVYLLYANKNKELRFHAVQAIIYGIILTIIAVIVPFVGGLIAFLGWVYGMWVGWQGYNGKRVKIPVIGDYAEKA